MSQCRENLLESNKQRKKAGPQNGERLDVKELVWTPGYSHACTPQTLEFSPIKPMNYFLLF